MMERETTDPILKALLALRKQHPLRQQANATFLDPQAPVEDLQPVLRALTSTSRFRRNERAVASWLIAHANWTEDQRITLSEKLAVKVDKAAKGSRADRVLLRWFQRGMIASALFFCLLIVLFTPSIRPIHIVGFCVSMLILSALLTVLCSFISLPLSLWMDHRRLRELSCTVEALGELGQPASIASLAKAAVHSPLRDAAASALKRVTAALRPEDLGALPGQPVPALCGVVTATAPETVLTALQALTLIGDGRAISTVEFLSVNAFRPDVRDAAMKLLPILRQRDFEHQSSSLLLRASDVPTDSGQTLLRPAHEQPTTTDPAQLLRMATPAENEHP